MLAVVVVETRRNIYMQYIILRNYSLLFLNKISDLLLLILRLKLRIAIPLGLWMMRLSVAIPLWLWLWLWVNWPVTVVALWLVVCCLLLRLHLNISRLGIICIRRLLLLLHVAAAV